MSHFATPFIVINLGCEMIYVVDQRLRAQEVSQDKSEKVLTEIVAVMLHPKLLQELFLPQPVALHNVIKRLLQDIASTSIMKLDDYSINKLWDLMTMIFKWQITIADNQNIFDITEKHLKSVAILMPQYFPRSIIEFARRKFQDLAQKISDDGYVALKNTVLLWFSEYHTKISVLLRLGLQKKDGTFVAPMSVNSNILANLGENIYNYDKKLVYGDKMSRCIETNEINCLLGEIKAKPLEVVELKYPIFRDEALTNATISINLEADNYFKKIETNIIGRTTDLSFSPSSLKSPHDSLIELLDKDN